MGTRVGDVPLVVANWRLLPARICAASSNFAITNTHCVCRHAVTMVSISNAWWRSTCRTSQSIDRLHRFLDKVDPRLRMPELTVYATGMCEMTTPLLT